MGFVGTIPDLLELSILRAIKRLFLPNENKNNLFKVEMPTRAIKPQR